MDCGESDSDSSSSSSNSFIAENRKRVFGACRPRIVAKDVLTPEEPPLPPVAEELRPWGVGAYGLLR